MRPVPPNIGIIVPGRSSPATSGKIPGEWILEPFGPAKTKATYKLCTDPGGAIPEFLVKQGTYTTMPQIITAVRQRVANFSGPPPALRPPPAPPWDLKKREAGQAAAT